MEVVFREDMTEEEEKGCKEVFDFFKKTPSSIDFKYYMPPKEVFEECFVERNAD